MRFKGLLIGVALIVLIGLGGFFYRSMSEQSAVTAVCTADAKICPDGTGLGRTGPSCSFPVCPLPNIDFGSANLALALPAGYVQDDAPTDDPTILGSFISSDSSKRLLIRQYVLEASTTPANFIRGNAIMMTSEMPAPATAFTSTTIASRRYSVVTLERFEGTVDTVYYLARESDVLRFDALSLQVANWTDPKLDVLSLAANIDLKKLLGTLQGN